MNKAISVAYAFKKDSKTERHGSDAERVLAASAKKNQLLPSSTGPQMGYPGMMDNNYAAAGYQGSYAGTMSQQMPGVPAMGADYYVPPPPPPASNMNQSYMPAPMPGMGPPNMQYPQQMMAPPAGFAPAYGMTQQTPYY